MIHKFVTTPDFVSRTKKMVVSAVIISVLALMFAWLAYSLAGRVQQGVVDQCNIISNTIDDPALRVYCTQLYQQEAR